MGGRVRARALDIGTGAVVLAAAALLVHDRVLPTWRAREIVQEGEDVPGDLRFVGVPGGEAAALPATSALLFVFQSTCPACERNLPAWRDLLERAPHGTPAWAIALEAPGPALAYAEAHLPGVRVVRPTDRARFLRILAIAAVPTTLVLDERGRLAGRIAGVLAPSQTDSILRLLTPAAAPVAAGGRPRE